MDDFEEEQDDEEIAHPADKRRKKRGKGNRKYPERTLGKPKTPEELMHEERKRIFINHLLYLSRKRNKHKG